jgi:hypothetical protein
MSESGRRLMRSGFLGEYEIHGLLKRGEKTWNIEECRSGENLPKQYCVIGTEFYAVRVNRSSADTNSPRELNLVTNMDRLESGPDVPLPF